VRFAYSVSRSDKSAIFYQQVFPKTVKAGGVGVTEFAISKGRLVRAPVAAVYDLSLKFVKAHIFD